MDWTRPWSALPTVFFEADPRDVAEALLGKVLARRGPGGEVRAGRIVETEAYLGTSDAASHAYRGPTPRTQVMFGPPGKLYVYRSYGVHWCTNVVCAPDGTAGAVLIRALDPCAGLEQIRLARPKAKRDVDLTSGPGKVCAALGITGIDNGTSVTSGPDVAVVEVGSPVVSGPTLGTGPRIGISKATDVHWRYWDTTSPYVSVRSTRARTGRG